MSHPTNLAIDEAIAEKEQVAAETEAENEEPTDEELSDLEAQEDGQK